MRKVRKKNNQGLSFILLYWILPKSFVLFPLLFLESSSAIWWPRRSVCSLPSTLLLNDSQSYLKIFNIMQLGKRFSSIPAPWWILTSRCDKQCMYQPPLSVSVFNKPRSVRLYTRRSFRTWSYLTSAALGKKLAAYLE